MPYHCRSCRKFFSVKTETVMHGSKLGYQKWALAICLLTTGLKGGEQHEAPPGPRHHPKDGVALDTPYPRDVGGQAVILYRDRLR